MYIQDLHYIRTYNLTVLTWVIKFPNKLSTKNMTLNGLWLYMSDLAFGLFKCVLRLQLAKAWLP